MNRCKSCNTVGEFDVDVNGNCVDCMRTKTINTKTIDAVRCQDCAKEIDVNNTMTLATGGMVKKICAACVGLPVFLQSKISCR